MEVYQLFLTQFSSSKNVFLKMIDRCWYNRLTKIKIIRENFWNITLADS